MRANRMADQILLKHLREAIGKIPLQQLEIELRLNRQLTLEMFQRLEAHLNSYGQWESVTETKTCDRTAGGVRVTEDRAIRKRRVAVSDAGEFRIATCQEEPVPVPAQLQEAFTRHKWRKEREFSGWKLATTVVNPDSPHPGYEVEVELDVLWLVRRPLEVLANTGCSLMDDVVRLTDTR